MAELIKDVSPEKTVQTLKDAAERAVQEATTKLQHEVAEALAQARQSAAALAEMPKMSNDLLVSSEVALVAEFEPGGQEQLDTRYVELRIGCGTFWLRREDYARVPPLREGQRYRALLFIVPIPGGRATR